MLALSYNMNKKDKQELLTALLKEELAIRRRFLSCPRYDKRLEAIRLQKRKLIKKVLSKGNLAELFL